MKFDKDAMMLSYYGNKKYTNWDMATTVITVAILFMQMDVYVKIALVLGIRYLVREWNKKIPELIWQIKNQ